MRLTGPVLALCLASAGVVSAADEAPKVAGTEVAVPKRIKFVPPEYPAEAQARGMRGIPSSFASAVIVASPPGGQRLMVDSPAASALA